MQDNYVRQIIYNLATSADMMKIQIHAEGQQKPQYIYAYFLQEGWIPTVKAKQNNLSCQH